MGYAGYVPAKLPPAKLTGVQALLKQISSPEALEVLYKLIYNVVVSPAEEKFRRVRLSNPRINAAVLGTEGSLDALRELGWERVEEGGEDWLVFPAGRTLSMREARWVQERQEQVAKDAREEARFGKGRSASSSTISSMAATEAG